MGIETTSTLELKFTQTINGKTTETTKKITADRLDSTSLIEEYVMFLKSCGYVLTTLENYLEVEI